MRYQRRAIASTIALIGAVGLLFFAADPPPAPRHAAAPPRDETPPVRVDHHRPPPPTAEPSPAAPPADAEASRRGVVPAAAAAQPAAPRAAERHTPSSTGRLLALANIRGFAQRVDHPKLDPTLRRVAAADADRVVAIEALATGATETLLDDLSDLDLSFAAAAGGLVSGLLPAARFDAALALPSLSYLRAADTLRDRAVEITPRHAGLTPFADQYAPLRRRFAVDGGGVVVGVLADSYDALGGEHAGIAAGALPGPDNPRGRTLAVDVLSALPVDHPGGGVDQGRAMIEVVHALAPGAAFQFASAQGGQATLAQSIRDLVAAGSHVIVDAAAYPSAPWFQDGPAAQAVEQASRAGAVYISAAGNAARHGYADWFRAGATATLTALGDETAIGDYLLHDFDPGDAAAYFQPVTLRQGQALDLWLQWSDPFASVCAGCPGAVSELDIFIASRDGDYASLIGGAGLNSLRRGDDGAVVGLDAFDRSGRLPAEGVYDGSMGDPLTLYVLIGKRLSAPGVNPTPRYLQWIDFGSGVGVTAYAAPAGTVVGQANAAGAISVGATDAATIGVSARVPGPVQSFSGAGGVPILLSERGERLSAARTRRKPDLVAPDGVPTSFYRYDGAAALRLGETTAAAPSLYFGTGAAAAHVAGVAALVLDASEFELFPEEVKRLLLGAAVDMDDPDTERFDLGFDARTGYGLLRAAGAVRAGVDYKPRPHGSDRVAGVRR